MSYALNPELRIAASVALLQRGCVNVISLAAIKAEAGPRWAKIGSAVSAHLESLLRQKLGASDFFIGLDDATFLVSTPSADAQTSQVLCLRVAHELHVNFLGVCEIGQLRIARAVGIKGDVLEVSDIVGQELLGVALRAGIACEGADIEWERKNIARLPRKAAAIEHCEEMFVPLWDAQREAITAYRCVTSVTPGVGRSAATATRAKVELAATLSRIAHAARSLSRCFKEGSRFLAFVPVTYDTLASPIGRMEIAAACRGLSESLRPYLVFEISDLPYGVPQSRLFELVGILRPFCRAVAGLLPARISSFGTYHGAGLQAIGLSMTANGAALTEMDSEVFKLCAAAKRLQVMSFVWDAVTKGAVIRARGQGANFISGPIIGHPVGEPVPIRRLTSEEISSLPDSSGWAGAV